MITPRWPPSLRNPTFPRPHATPKSNKLPNGEVVRQDPPAGMNLTTGTQVQLFVSAGPATAPTDQNLPISASSVPHKPTMIPVPDVAGLPEATAVKNIEGSQLRVALVGREASTEPLATVSRTVPQALVPVPSGTVVHYWLSLGQLIESQPPPPPPSSAPPPAPPPPPVRVPFVIGMTPDQAATILRNTGLVAGEPISELSLAQAGRISRQDPLAEDRVPRGIFISLWYPHAGLSVSSLVVVSLAVLVFAAGGVLVHIRRKQRLRYTRRVTRMRASTEDLHEWRPDSAVPLVKPVIALHTRIEAGDVHFHDPLVIEREEIKHD